MELLFKSDTKYRKHYFTGLHFSHPAKMHLSLQMWLIDNFTQPGEVILDPMAGSGTILVACMMGRDVVTVELEDKFVKMQEGNWEKIKTRGPMMGFEMGQATILQGDARNLEGLLADKIITSPPYASGGHHPDQTGAWGGQAQALTQEQANYGQSEGQIGNLPYGSIDKVITSPPYSQTGVGDWQTGRAEFQEWVVNEIATKGYVEWQGKRYTESEWRAMNHGRIDGRTTKGVHKHPTNGYNRDNTANIGNLKSDSYLSAMLQVYQQCYAVLKQGGLLILVTKNFIRNKEEIRLDEDTIQLCETAGFSFKERHYRKLTQQSFWRVIYQQKYPDAPVLNKEDILVFEKEN